jgi:hypothetical protein
MSDRADAARAASGRGHGTPPRLRRLLVIRRSSARSTIASVTRTDRRLSCARHEGGEQSAPPAASVRYLPTAEGALHCRAAHSAGYGSVEQTTAAVVRCSGDPAAVINGVRCAASRAIRSVGSDIRTPNLVAEPFKEIEVWCRVEARVPLLSREVQPCRVGDGIRPRRIHEELPKCGCRHVARLGCAFDLDEVAIDQEVGVRAERADS